jgi:hypothetical protein
MNLSDISRKGTERLPAWNTISVSSPPDPPPPHEEMERAASGMETIRIAAVKRVLITGCLCEHDML